MAKSSDQSPASPQMIKERFVPATDRGLAILNAGVAGLSLLVVAGMLKLLHLHRAHDELTEEEIAPLVEFAVEMQRRTTDQLAKLLPSEFSQIDYTYKLRRRE